MTRCKLACVRDNGEIFRMTVEMCDSSGTRRADDDDDDDEYGMGMGMGRPTRRASLASVTPAVR